jgi:hypothetical protein
MTIDGTWKVTILTPIGKQSVVFEISTQQGLVRGTATQGAETVEFVDPVIAGNRLTWSQRVTKPFHLELKFDVEVDGEGRTMMGTAKAGLLPASRLTGERVA